MISLLQQSIEKIANEKLIDEVRFIDAENLTNAHIGNVDAFKGRQPRDIMPEAKSVILFSTYIGKYASADDSGVGRMSRLVLSGYYANIVSPLNSVKEFLEKEGYKALIMDGEKDEPSIPLKGSAVKAGLGWIGKTTLVVNPKYGTFQALGAIITDADIGQTYPMIENKCGSCTKCIDACPSKALNESRVIDRPNCMSDMLDEGREIPSDVSSQGFFFECDICQNACPWNEKHLTNPLDTPYGRLFNPSKINKIMDLNHLESMDEATYNKEIIPYMIGYKLPFDIFKNNLKHVIKKV